MTQVVGIEFIANDESIISGFNRQIKKAEELESITERLSKSQEAAAKSTEMVSKAQDVLSGEINQTVKESKSLVNEQAVLNTSLKKQIGDIKVFGVSINDVTTKLKGWQSNLTGVVKSLTGTNKALGLFKIALASTGIGLIVVALGSLTAFLTRTTRGTDILTAASKGLGAAFEVLLDIAEGLGETLFDTFSNPKQAISDLAEFLKTVLFDATIGRVQSLATAVKLLFDGDFQGAAKEAVDVLSGVNNTVDKVVDGTQSLIDKTKEVVTEIKEETKAAVALERARQKLRDAEIELRIETAKSRAEIKELNKVAEDTTKSYDERRDAAAKAIAIEQRLLTRRIDLAQQNADIIKEQNALSNNLVEDNEKLADAQIRVDELKTESLELQTTLQNKLNTINQDQIRGVNALKKSIDDIKESLSDELSTIQGKNDPVFKILDDRKKRVEELNATIQKFQEEALKLGLSDEATNETLEKFKKLIALINADAKKELEKLRGVEGLSVLPSTLDEDVVVRADVKATFANVPEAKAGLTEQINDLLNGVEFDAVQKLTSSISNALVSGINNQISELDKISEKRKDQIAELEEGLEEEQDLRERGFSLNVDGKREEIENLQALEAADQKKREELQKKAQQIQLVNDAIQQASSLATAAANIQAGFASIPIAGVLLGIAAVANMYAAFTKFKSDTSATKRLNKGSDRLYDDVGQIAPGEGSDVPGRGKPEFRIVDSKNNIRAVVGGEEMLIDGNTSLSHGKVVQWIKSNKSKLSAVDMISLLEGSAHPLSRIKIESNGGSQLSDLSNRVHTEYQVQQNRQEELNSKQFVDGVENALEKILGNRVDKLITATSKKEERWTEGGRNFVKVTA